jgi:alginate O-acetyltransferase complex protein AlgI
VCFLSGLWQGASWLFVIWGLLQGAYMIIGHMTKKWRKKLNETVGTSKVKWLDHALDIIITFSLTAFARVFFRGNSLDDARYFVWKLKDLPADLLKILRTHHIGLSGVHPHPEVLPAVVVMVIGLEVAHLLKLRYDLEHTFSSRPALMRWGLYFSGLILLLFFGVYNSQRFIYFQF